MTEATTELVEVTREDRLAADALFKAASAFPLTAKLHAIVSEAFARQRASLINELAQVDAGKLVEAFSRLSTRSPAPDQVEVVASHKWFDPECAANGCRSLILASLFRTAPEHVRHAPDCPSLRGNDADCNCGAVEWLDAVSAALGASPR